MSFSILVATPTVAFGDLIRDSLEESGRYRVQVVHNDAEAKKLLGIGGYRIVILDSDLENNGMRSLAARLNGSQLEHKLVLIPPANNPRHPLMAGLNCDAYLRKPFYLPDLFELVDELAADSFSEPVDVESRLKWLDPAELERLGIAAGARTAMVMLSDGAAVFGGVLPEGSHGILLELAGRFWQRPERTDLVRFVRLKGEEQDSLLYLTAVTETGETCLALLYPNTSPLSKVRSQSGQFVRELRELAGKSRNEADAPPPATVDTPIESPTEDEKEPVFEGSKEDDQGDEAALKDFNLAELLGSIPSPDPNSKLPASGAEFSIDDWMPEFLAALQTNGNTPGNLGGSRSDIQTDRLLERPADSGMGEEEPAFDADARVVQEPTWNWVAETEELSPETPVLDLKGIAGGEIEPDSIFNQPLPPLEDDEQGSFRGAEAPVFPPETAGQGANDWAEIGKLSLTDSTKENKPNAHEDVAVGEKPMPAAPVEEDPSSTEPTSLPIEERVISEEGLISLPEMKDIAEGENDETNYPSSLSSLVGPDPLEMESEEIDQARYTCVLIPRLPQIYLTRELSERVNQWVRELCLEMGWRLVGISLRPDYFQWTVQISVSILPGSMVKIVRQRTSDFVLSQFERLRQENPSGDFWANSYLIVSGTQPLSAHLLRDYIVQTRREGLERPAHITS